MSYTKYINNNSCDYLDAQIQTADNMLLSIVNEKCKEDKNISKINSFYLNIPESFIDDINRYNNIIINNQIINIDKIINNIKLKTYIRNTPNIIQTSIGVEWCNQYKLPINKLYT